MGQRILVVWLALLVSAGTSSAQGLAESANRRAGQVATITSSALSDAAARARISQAPPRRTWKTRGVLIGLAAGLAAGTTWALVDCRTGSEQADCKRVTLLIWTPIIGASAAVVGGVVGSQFSRPDRAPFAWPASALSGQRVWSNVDVRGRRVAIGVRF